MRELTSAERKLPDFQSRVYLETLAEMRAKRLRDPAFWDYNATLMRDPDFARISRNYAERLRNHAD